MLCLLNNWASFLLTCEKASELAKSLCFSTENIKDQNVSLQMEREGTLYINFYLFFLR